MGIHLAKCWLITCLVGWSVGRLVGRSDGRLVGWLVGRSVGDYRLLWDFCPYGIIIMNVYFVITVAMVVLLSDFGPYKIIFMIILY
jgi:hypothetical protein